MDLKGAKIRNIFELCTDMTKDGESNLKVNIPFYQRPYKWEQEYIENLINDFFKYGEISESSKEYFVGSIVAVNNKNSYDIIDGQQRITTVYLVGYVKFLVYRSYIEELILLTKPPSNIKEHMKKLKNLYSKLLISNESLDNVYGEIKVKIKDIEEMQASDLNGIQKEEKRKEMFEELLLYYKESMKLPLIKDFTKQKEYGQEYTEKLEDLFEGKRLALRYSRDTLNKKLNNSLTKVWIEFSDSNSPKLNILEEYSESDPIIERYVSSMKYIFDTFYTRCNNGTDDALVFTTKIIDAMNSFLKNLKFCVIVTGNEQDAYTLFEVLNDRALAISDLDLVKNLFYKKYVLSSSDVETKKDRFLEYLEKSWGENIFLENIVNKNKLILYLTTVFLTGDKDIDYKSKHEYRKTIEDKYLDKNFDDKNNIYEFKNIKNDFKIFEFIKIILDKFNIVFKSKEAKALKTEADIHKSITSRTLHLLSALKQESVMTAIVNLILATFIERNNKKDFTLQDFNSFIDELVEIKSENDDIYKNIHELSHNIWKLTLLSSSYKIPREYAKTIVSTVHYCNRFNYNNSFSLSSNDLSYAEKEFEEWTEIWRYKSSMDFRVKMLFLILLKTTKKNGELTFNPTTISINTDKLNLDHLEAEKINVENEIMYFKPDNSSNRETYINALGNFMILDITTNINKSNSPIYKAIKHYKKAGILGRHWLVEEFKSLLEDDKYSKKVKINGEYQYVPKEEFFNKRRQNLQEDFLKVLSKSFKSK